ncbi:MAG: hypothetical protein JW828_01625 [Sedimentisphaerales bacterium]|nr:hypothetical protein [Sedimentisphaerales bacterium]
MRGHKQTILVMLMIDFFLSVSYAILEDIKITSDHTIQKSQSYDTVTVWSVGNPTVVDFYGFACSFETYDSSIVNVYDDAQIMDDEICLSHVDLWDTSVVNLFDEARFFSLEYCAFTLHDAGTLNLYGGEVFTFFCARDFSIVNLYEGSLSFGFFLEDNAVLNVYGGEIVPGLLWENFIAPTATINMYGHDFTFTEQGDWVYFEDPEHGFWVSKLTGTNLEGTEVTYWGLPDPATHSNIHFIPEPSAVLLVALGTVLLRKRK